MATIRHRAAMQFALWREEGSESNPTLSPPLTQLFLGSEFLRFQLPTLTPSHGGELKRKCVGRGKLEGSSALSATCESLMQSTNRVDHSYHLLGRAVDWARGIIGYFRQIVMLKPTAHRNISNFRHRHFLPNQKPFLVQEESLLRLSETHGEIIHFTHFHIGPLSGIQNEVKEEESRLEGATVKWAMHAESPSPPRKIIASQGI